MVGATCMEEDAMNTSETVYLWPCGTFCYEEELEELLTFMSDDYRALGFDQLPWTGDQAPGESL